LGRRIGGLVGNGSRDGVVDVVGVDMTRLGTKVAN
jgi:hypothetical protein